jgi:hypothetical protein
MKYSVSIITIVITFLITTGCEEFGSDTRQKVVGTGPVVSTNLDLSSFTGIENTGVANIYVTIGTPQSVVLKAQQNIIDVMTWEVRDNTLEIGVDKNVSIENSEEIRFDITIPSLTKVDLAGVGDFILSGDDQDELTIKLTGVGNVESYDMRTGICNITMTGVGNCQVNVIDELNVTITGVGSVYYKGNPTINSTITGLGQLINAN